MSPFAIDRYGFPEKNGNRVEEEWANHSTPAMDTPQTMSMALNLILWTQNKHTEIKNQGASGK